MSNIFVWSDEMIEISFNYLNQGSIYKIATNCGNKIKMLHNMHIISLIRYKNFAFILRGSEEWECGNLRWVSLYYYR